MKLKSLAHLLASGALVLTGLARADAVQTLKDFGREVKSGKAEFTQTVSSPDGQRKKSSSGSFEFQRPNQFRFAYTKPFEQLIVGDGQKVWIYDPDLKQASARRMSAALGATPAALLAGANLEKDFELKALPAAQGLDWVQAQPRQADAGLQSLKVGFKGRELAAIEVVDGFGQRSLLQFSAVQTNAPVAAERFRFVLPPGADLIEQ
ncbi:outer membrane lipoprotein chaperone LolA [Kinneretia asaccharophila]|uniref:Outer-membrane lipoprotein carrier protein n=1 Tax=Roseateles asaccharophilus TaxID=582607 RepID=A0A4R6NC20_9BURK|nr:outer membrane lipoprotein chaperone LolA [Roseateles asaccharophilus]MDN3543408.1 outer membrane lipoprotein chaperone LolA [Roseateles asaccharophilus]TDP12214.1 outer membrane lipoprotein carrier protein [Roseateles asaccharophilus]